LTLGLRAIIGEVGAGGFFKPLSGLCQDFLDTCCGRNLFDPEFMSRFFDRVIQCGVTKPL
jgi:hypothetical protein